MHPNKASCYYDIRALYYQYYWDVIGDYVCVTCLGFLNGGYGIDNINKTIISIIPKVNSLTKFVEFHRISLCTIIYNIIYKVPGFTKVLPNLIDETYFYYRTSNSIKFYGCL